MTPFSAAFASRLLDDLDTVHLVCADGIGELARPQTVVAAEVEEDDAAVAGACAPGQVDDVPPVQLIRVVVDAGKESLEHRKKLIATSNSTASCVA